MAHRELLRPPWWVWLGADAGAALLAVEVGTATTRVLGWVCFAVVSLGAFTLLHRATLTVAVADGELRAGPARAPLPAFDTAFVHDARTLRLRRGRDADPAAYVAVSPWVHTAVELRVADPADPTPYWLVSTRQPRRLLDALGVVLAPDSSAPPG